MSSTSIGRLRSPRIRPVVCAHRRNFAPLPVGCTPEIDVCTDSVAIEDYFLVVPLEARVEADIVARPPRDEGLGNGGLPAKNLRASLLDPVEESRKVALLLRL